NVLSTHRDKLDTIAKALVEHETIEKGDFEKILRGEPIDLAATPTDTVPEAEGKADDQRAAATDLTPNPKLRPAEG
ncbi:MAG: hypothetical protein M1335_00065, partial [Chloroflexi bacterium]|nr:hypothetical protein [Chloroflexota bacterium]